MAMSPYLMMPEQERVLATLAQDRTLKGRRDHAAVATQVAQHLGQPPMAALADAGYFSEANLTAPALAGMALYVPPDRQHHRDVGQRRRATSPISEARRATLRTVEGHALYARRKAIVEPVFGQIKEARGFRRFSFRGVGKVTAEWAVICLTHNLLKLFRAPARFQAA